MKETEYFIVVSTEQEQEKNQKNPEHRRKIYERSLLKNNIFERFGHAIKKSP